MACLRLPDPLERLRCFTYVQLRQQHECPCAAAGDVDPPPRVTVRRRSQHLAMQLQILNGGTEATAVVRQQQQGAYAVANAELASSECGIALLDAEFARASPGRELSPAGDPATSLERSLLERQWTLSLEELSALEKELNPRPRRRGRPRKVEQRVAVEEREVQEQQEPMMWRGLGQKKKKLRTQGQEVEREQEHAMTQERVLAAGQRWIEPNKRRLVTSGKPSARQRRLQARQERLARAPELPAPFTVRPSKKNSDKGRPRGDGLQDYLTAYLRDITRIDLLSKDEEIELSKTLKLGAQLKEVRKNLELEMGCAPTNEQWAAQVGVSSAHLLSTLNEADMARDKMVMSNLRLVVSVAKRYNNRGLELADLIQEGSIGLVRGVEKFDHTRGYKLSTYVHWWIRQGVTRAIADHSSTVRIPVHVHDTLARIRKVRNRLASEGAVPTVEKISKSLNISRVKVQNALKTKKRMKSIDREIGRNNVMDGDKETFHNIVPDRDLENHPWALVDRILLKEDVNILLTSILSQREQDILKMHYGVGQDDGQQLSFDKIGLRHGVSRERARQLGTSAIKKLQLSAQSKGLERAMHGA